MELHREKCKCLDLEYFLGNELQKQSRVDTDINLKHPIASKKLSKISYSEQNYNLVTNKFKIKGEHKNNPSKVIKKSKKMSKSRPFSSKSEKLRKRRVSEIFGD